MDRLLRSISAELTKLKYAPILWLCLLVISIVTAIVFLSCYLDGDAMTQLGVNPWRRHLSAGVAIFSVFLGVPLIVMLTSTAIFIENNARGWKYVYSTPHYRSTIFYAKLIAILCVLLTVIVAVIIMNICCAFALDLLLPETEFRYYDMHLHKYLPDYLHTLTALMGVIGIQYFLSLRFKGFLIPMSIGIIAFIVGLIIGSMNKPIALYYPYSYPNIVKDHHMFTIDQIGVTEYGWLNNVEIHSIVIFVCFVGLANLLELRKNIN